MISIARNLGLAACPLALLVASAGCSHERPAPVLPTSSQVTPSTAKADATPAQTASSINVAPDIRAICGVHDTSSDGVPEFAFDSSQLTSTDRSLLQQVAACVTKGPLKGRALRLVGRADPRGTEEYNMGLGMRRAGSVRAYLQRAGMRDKNLSLISRGALDAAGHDETGWQKDRRVDIVLDDGAGGKVASSG